MCKARSALGGVGIIHTCLPDAGAVKPGGCAGGGGEVERMGVWLGVGEAAVSP